MSTSSIVPIPMALPRRPYLLGVFPGTSSDWATRDRVGGGGQREIKTLQSEKARAQKKEGIIKSHAQNRTTEICNMQNSRDNNKDKKAALLKKRRKTLGEQASMDST